MTEKKSNIYKDKKGYPRFKDTDELVHRKVAEKKVGGPIGKGRVVHHKDENKMNFRPSNLEIKDRGEHTADHNKKRKKKTSKK